MDRKAKLTAPATSLGIAMLLLLTLSAWADIGPGFTYQGELRVADTPIAGDYDFRFRLYGSATGGTRIGPVLDLPAVAVVDGVFTVQLDFGGAALSGQARWLEIDVRASGDPGFETLAPRTLLATVPYAWGAAVALPGSVSAASIQSGAVGADEIVPGQVQRRVSGACPAGEFLRSINQDGSVNCSAGAGGGLAWLLGGNAGTDPAVDYLGTSDDQPLVLGANGQPLVRVEAAPVPASSSYTANITMGNADNTIRPGVRGATIGGGGLPLSTPDSIFNPNVVHDHFGTIGGGHANVAGSDDANTNNAQWATVGGGVDNRAGGQGATVGGGEKNFAINNQATISGGERNAALGVASTVVGGFRNLAADREASVVGGGFNTAAGISSIVVGGESNCAGGRFSLAGGRNAKVRPTVPSGATGTGCANVSGTGTSGGDQGTFMWADSQNANFQSTGSDQFLVRAQGGVFFGTGGAVSLPVGRFINTSSGAHLTTGGTWTNASSRSFKTDFEAVDPLEILDRLLKLPMRTWTYLSAPENGRHLGPVAEEFHASFGLGSDDTSITTVDASGVALAAIQGLNQRLQAENTALRRQNADQDAAIAELRAELDELRRALLPAAAQEP